MYFQKKGRVTVINACEMAFDRMPEVFSALRFCATVRMMTNRPNLMDTTTLRRLREIRADSEKYQYRCIDTEKSLYKKTTY